MTVGGLLGWGRLPLSLSQGHKIACTITQVQKRWLTKETDDVAAGLPAIKDLAAAQTVDHLRLHGGQGEPPLLMRLTWDVEAKRGAT